MRLLEFVSCGCKVAPKPAEEKEAATVDRPPRGDVAAAIAPEKRLHRAASQWRPSLGAISENRVFRLEEEGGARAAPAPGKARRGAASLAAAVGRFRTWCGREFAAPTSTMPAGLAPSPFFWF